MQQLGKEETLNLTLLSSVFGDDKAAMCELLQMFLASTATNLELLHRAIERREGGSVREFAHKIRGSAANMGAERIALCVGAIEEEVRASGRWSEVEALLTPLQPELSALQAEIEKFSGFPLALHPVSSG